MEAKVLPACPVETTLTLISNKWKVLIIRDLLSGTKRFGALKKSIGGVSQKVLTSQLRQMEENGLLTRTVFPEVPPRVEYSLTELGRSLKPVLDAMGSWGEEYRAMQTRLTGRGIPEPPDQTACPGPESSTGNTPAVKFEQN
ncbi:MAG: helix-turn-helix transcriptional regulator [Lawsonibacter sp.]|nr:helix-turn-helix transcriptional regulator [Lawsonibacter sp.]